MREIKKEKDRGFVGLCYHYIRPEKTQDPFPRILGNRVGEFRKQLSLLKREYRVLSPQEVSGFVESGWALRGDKHGVLITFDDGLSDHYLAAKILAENGIKALFFIPTCVLSDRLPANPTIIHYSIAQYGIERFLKVYTDALKRFGLKQEEYQVRYARGSDDPWKCISLIKSIFRYRLGYKVGREVLMEIYENLFHRDRADSLEQMHLTSSQVREILVLGHSIGVHSHTHVSVAATKLEEIDFLLEVDHPKDYLEKTFGVPVNAFSYPFGSKADCLSAEHLIAKTNRYSMAFTVDTILNTSKTSPLEFGRYMPMSQDDDVSLHQKIEAIIGGREV